jgi:hypothetical protein
MLQVAWRRTGRRKFSRTPPSCGLLISKEQQQAAGRARRPRYAVWISVIEFSLALVLDLTPQERSFRASIAAHEMHAKYGDKTTGTIRGTAAFLDRFKRQAIEAAKGEHLTDVEIERRADHLLRAHMRRLALESSKARARKGTRS